MHTLYNITGCPFSLSKRVLVLISLSMSHNECLESIVKTFILNMFTFKWVQSHPEKTCKVLETPKPQTFHFHPETVLVVVVCAWTQNTSQSPCAPAGLNGQLPIPTPWRCNCSAKINTVPAQKGDVFEKRCREAAQKRQRAPGNVFLCQRPS